MPVALLVPLAAACSHAPSHPAAAGATTGVLTAASTAAGSATLTRQASASASSRHGAGTTSTGPAGTASSGPADGPARCAESQLRASIDPRHIPGNGTAGKDGRLLHAVLIDFQNTSRSTCVLDGYPGAAIVDEAGHQVRQATRTLQGPLLGLPVGQSVATPVTLAPQAYASAGLEGVDERNPGTAQAGCDAPHYPRILITPPNTFIPVPFTVGWPRCYSFEVHAVRALSEPPRVGLAAFVGDWSGHTRRLTVAPDGTAAVLVDDGCCTRVYTSKMKLSNGRGTVIDGSATATLTQLQVNPGALGHGPVPKVGDSRTITIRNGVLTDPFFNVTFCDATVSAPGTCGA
ncbi:DUF4232 domain-containing protein [Jatrophihabitans sp.]|uniref:DUF4232 domain-containing protein n=1 Tax=Jatrophihabitans sp. TaxID=1932789 RepID=UPI002F15B65E